MNLKEEGKFNVLFSCNGNSWLVSICSDTFLGHSQLDSDLEAKITSYVVICSKKDTVSDTTGDRSCI